MARKRDTGRQRRRRREGPMDLDPYLGCAADAVVGLDPLGVGWLQHNQPFPTGPVPEPFLAALLPFCFDENVVCAVRVARRCPLCNAVVPPIEREGHTAHPGTGEIRVLGESEIYAAPDLILHHITAHNYQPPEEFIQAVLLGPPAGAPEHRVLVRTLNGS